MGNPPYIKEYTNKEIFESVKKTRLKKYYQGKMDLWYLFTCKAIDLLKDSGLHSFIAQNNWITSFGASILRNKCLKDTKIVSFFDFNDFKIFKDAGIQTMIFVLKKINPSKSYNVDYYKVINKNISKMELKNYLVFGKNDEKIEHFKAKISPQELLNRPINFTNSEYSNLLDKIKSYQNYKFDDHDISTGIDVHQDFVNDKHLNILKDLSIKKGDSIFNLSNTEYESLKLSQKEKDIIKPFYTTEELFRYYGNPLNHLWVIYSDMKTRKNMNEYPKIKSHLDKFKKVITSDFKPYGLHRSRERRFFEGEKIVSLRKTSQPCFTYTDFPCYVSQTYFVLKPSNINLKYLTALLNSKIVHFWLYLKGKKQGNMLQIDKAPLLDIPIHKLKNESEKKMESIIIGYVENIIQLNKGLINIRLDSERELIKKQIKSLEYKINDFVFKIYEINDSEREIIERCLKNG